MSPHDAQNQPPSPWNPTMFVRFEQPLDTSMGTARIVTDAGPAYINSLFSDFKVESIAANRVADFVARV